MSLGKESNNNNSGVLENAKKVEKNFGQECTSHANAQKRGNYSFRRMGMNNPVFQQNKSNDRQMQRVGTTESENGADKLQEMWFGLSTAHQPLM